MKLRPRLSRRIALLVALIAGLGAVGAAPAFAAGAGTITVQAANIHGVALSTAGWNIALEAPHGQSSYFDQEGETNSSGLASFSDIPAGHSYIAWISAAAPYISAHKTGITLTNGQSKTVNVDLPLGATISGTLTSDGTAISGATVALLNSDGDRVGATTTNPVGEYTLTVKSGTYRIQFNARPSENLSAAALSDAWSYWKSSVVWSAAKAVTVKQQTTTKTETQLLNINGTVAHLYRIIAEVSLSGITHANEVEVVASHTADSFETELVGGGTGFETWVNPGKYRVGLVGNYDPIVGDYPVYWFTGNDMNVTTNESHAKWVSITDADAEVYFQDASNTD